MWLSHQCSHSPSFWAKVSTALTLQVSTVYIRIPYARYFGTFGDFHGCKRRVTEGLCMPHFQSCLLSGSISSRNSSVKRRRLLECGKAVKERSLQEPWFSAPLIFSVVFPLNQSNDMLLFFDQAAGGLYIYIVWQTSVSLI